jgi:hypothetical protein
MSAWDGTKSDVRWLLFLQGGILADWVKGAVRGMKHLEPWFNGNVWCGETYIIHEEIWIFMLKCKKLKYTKSVINMGTKVYKNMPKFIKEINDYKSFKKS